MSVSAPAPAPSAAPAPAPSPAEFAAITVLLLEEEEAAGVLSRLGPDELRQLGTAMCGLAEVEGDRIADALGGFMVEAARDTLPASDRQERVRSLMASAVGAHKAGHLMQRIAPEAAGRSLAIARWLAPEAILALAGDQPPQVLAVLLLLLEPVAAAQVMALLPPAVQPQVVERVARLERVPPQAAILLNALLERRMAERVGAATLALGGPREAAELINRVTGGFGKQVLPAIAQDDPALAQAIEAELVTFAMLAELDGQGIGRLLREVENAVLVDALKGLDEDGREPFFAAMSSRAADGVRDEIELRGRIGRADVAAAQKAMVALARRLADAGEIVFGAGDDELY